MDIINHGYSQEVFMGGYIFTYNKPWPISRGVMGGWVDIHLLCEVILTETQGINIHI